MHVWHQDCLLLSSEAGSFTSRTVKFWNRTMEMKSLTKILFTLVIMAGLSVVAFAQKDEQKRPKPAPPVVKPGDKKPPKNDDKPKKAAIDFVASKEVTGTLDV